MGGSTPLSGRKLLTPVQVTFMCNISVIDFFFENVDPKEFRGKSVLEVGSKYVNGSVRPLIERFCDPAKYLGVDIEPGKFVDEVVPAERLVERFGENAFDVVISTEMLEHVRNWRTVINNLKAVVKPNGLIYLTTRSFGFPYHAYPYDFWRYEVEDMEKIFADFRVVVLEKDREPGVLLKAVKPPSWNAVDLSQVSLYSMLTGRRTQEIPNKMTFKRKIKVQTQLLLHSTAASVYKKLLALD
jgi:SAM-dependent methyltransferase